MPTVRASCKPVLAGLGMTMVVYGCSGLPPYEPPRSGAVAHVRVVTTHDGINLQVRRFRAPDCADYPGELIGRLNSKTLGDQFSPALETTVPVNEPFRLSVYAVSAMEGSIRGDGWIRSKVTFCQPAFEFVPRQGGRYEIVHRVGDGGCTLEISEVLGAGRSSVASTSKSHECSVAYHRQRR